MGDLVNGEVLGRGFFGQAIKVSVTKTVKAKLGLLPMQAPANLQPNITVADPFLWLVRMSFAAASNYCPLHRNSVNYIGVGPESS